MRRRAMFAAVAILFSAVTAIGCIGVVDIWLHAKHARWMGYNVWGYRGRIAPPKRPGEYRIVMLGGSVAYGYSAPPTATIPVQLEDDLEAATHSTRFSAVNLAYNSEGAYSFAFTLQDYAYLQYDLAILYEGYNDIRDEPPNTQVFRHQSPIFRMTGYLPIFPLIFREKAATMLAGGDVAALYRKQGKAVFRPPWTSRAGAQALMTAASVEAAIEKQLDRASPRVSHSDSAAGLGCLHVPHYCESIARAVDVARARGASVLVATQPYMAGEIRPIHQQQQSEMAAMLSRRYAGDPRVAYVNLGEVIDLSDDHLSGDGMHPTAEGNARTATALVPAILKMAAQ